MGSPIGLYGAERWILALVRHLSAEHIESSVGVINDDPNLQGIPLLAEAAKLGLKTVEFRSHGKLSASAVGKIREFIRAENIDVLHTHGYKTDLIGLLAVRGTSCKLVTTPHGWSTDAGIKLQVYEFLDRLGFYFADAVAPLSPDLYNGLRRMPGLQGKLRLILNGVDISEIDAVMAGGNRAALDDGSSFLIGYIGQLIHRKGIGTLIKAFHELDLPGKRLQLIGEGPQRAELEALAASLGETDRIQFLGYREDRLELLKQFDVFVLPSSLEGIPRCLMEAMAAEVPIVATNIPGCTDLIAPGETGILFELDDAAALTSRLMQLASQADLRRELATNGRQLILDKYSAAAMANNYTDTYAELVGERAGSQ